MRLLRLVLGGHRSVEELVFEAGPFTVLFGKNNAGKTNILETIYGAFAPDGPATIRQTHAGRDSRPRGAFVAQLESGVPFDDAVIAAVGPPVAPGWDEIVTFTREGIIFPDDLELLELEDPDFGGFLPDVLSINAADGPSMHLMYLDWRFSDLHERVEVAIAQLAATESSLRRGDWSWLEYVDGEGAYRVPAMVERRVKQLSSLASDLLPDFVNGWIEANVTMATNWGDTPKVLLEYHQRGETQCADLIDAAGQGVARWMSAAVQIALHLMAETDSLDTVRDLAPGFFSGHVLLIDEPEAHLHPAAVASMVRWCHRMVRHGFTIVVASHHDEFLRAAGDEVTLVHVTRDEDLVYTWARTLPSATTARLQELALDIGMHPAAALSLHRAILFVEGPLDEAVLDEYASLKLDAAGVKIIPIYGTKNLEGLIAVEIVTQLGLKIGILTDGTDVDTMADRSNKRRTSEEKKVLRVLQIARDRGLSEPQAFGVTEDDLLFALPADGIRQYLNGPFPGWKELREECRKSEGKTPSDSVDWKSYALRNYNLPITSPEGVRHIVRHLDLANVPMKSIDMVVMKIVEWANRDDGSNSILGADDRP